MYIFIGSVVNACSGPAVISDSLQPYRLQLTRLLCPRSSPDMNTQLGYHFLLQGIFQTQGSNLGLLHCKWTLYR